MKPITLFLHLCVVFCLLLNLFGLALPAPVEAQSPSYAWVAHNDCVTTSGHHTTANTTTIPYNGSGTLNKQSDGSSTGITATFTYSGTIQTTSNGTDSNARTDAYSTFYPYADMAGVVNSSTTGWYVDLTLSGLDPNKTYTFAGTATRDGDYTTRNSTFILSGDTAATNASTSGVTVANDHTITFNTGTNRTQGYVVRWTGINPGSDGEIVIRARASTTSEIAGSSTNAYGLSVFMLAEESTDPTITVNPSSLSGFTSTPGTPSAAQTYTVSGSNLTGDITVTAPGGFELSTDGSSYSPSLTLTPSGGSVPTTTVYVCLYSATEGTFSGNITHTSTGAVTKNVAVSGTTTNQLPNAPTLVQPADNATGVSTSPTLQVTASDPESDPMDVSFYGRVAGAGTGTCPEFTVVVMPDTQNMSTSYPAVFNSMTQWIANNKTAQNIAFVTHVGDIVNTSGSTTEWGNADAAFDILDLGNVPYSVGPGNHDLGGLYNSYFGPSRFSGKTWYQGSYATNQNENNYSFFSASGMDFMVVNLQFGTTTGSGQLAWADTLLANNPNRRAIYVQHDLLNLNNSWLNQAPYTALSDNANLFLMLCGHMHSPSDGSAYRNETRTGMPPVHILLSDWQDYNYGNGYLRLLRFAPALDTITATVYSPYTGDYLTNASNYEQFAMTYDMDCANSASYKYYFPLLGKNAKFQ